MPESGGRILVAVVVLALVVRGALVLGTPDYEPQYDAGDYVRHAVSISGGQGFPDTVFASGGGPSAFRPPLYPYILGGVFAGSGDSETAGRLLGAGLGALAVYLVYLVAAKLWDRRTALVAAGLAALAPPLVFLSGSLGTEPLFLVLELAAVLFALLSRERGGSVPLAAAAGACCGLAALTRSNGVLLAVPIALGLLTLRPLLSRRALAAPAAVVAGAILVVVPWTVRNAITFDDLVPISSQTGFATAGQYNDQAKDFPGYPATWLFPSATRRYAPVYARADLDEAELDAELRRLALEWARAHPLAVVEATVRNTGRTLELHPTEPSLAEANLRQLDLSETEGEIDRFFFYALVALTLASVVLAVRRRGERRIPHFVWVAPLLMFIVAQPLLGLTRYRAPLLPFLAIGAAPALVVAADRLAPVTRRR